VAVDTAGHLFIVDDGNQRIRRVDLTGTITTVAGNGTAGFSGDGGAATSASLYYPGGVAVDTTGHLFIVDSSDGRIRSVGGSSVTPVAMTKVYGASDPVLAGTLTGFFVSDNVTATYSRTAGETVGTYVTNATLAPATVLGGYAITFNTAIFTIAKAPLTITANDQSQAYGAAIAPLTVSYAGFVNSDTAGSLTTPPTVTTTATSSSNAGTYSITASGAGSPNYAISYVPGTLTVTPAVTATMPTSSRNPANSGQSLTFTATVSSRAGTPAGSAMFNDGVVPLGTVVLKGGVASFGTRALTSGTHSITAVYLGATNFQGSSSPAVSQIVKAPTFTSLSSTVNPGVFGQAVTFTATVTSGTGTPDGSVTFRNGANALGSATLNAGSASLTVASLSVATHVITAVYGGSSTFVGSTSAALNETVNAAGTTTTITSTVNPSASGESITLTAAVAAVLPGAGTPAGPVTFTDTTTSTTLGSRSLSGGSASLTVSSLSVSTHAIIASFGATGDFSASTSQPLNQVVNPAATTVTVASSRNPSIVGQPVTFTAHVVVVAPGKGTPTGTVSFYDGLTLLASVSLTSGSAKFSTTGHRRSLTPLNSSRTMGSVLRGDDNSRESASPPWGQLC
jgi:hypothetical protein